LVTLFRRLALSKNKDELLALAKVGNDIQKPFGGRVALQRKR